MLAKGLATDPGTGRPIVEVAEEKKQIREKEEEQVLKDRAAFAGTLASEPGKLILGMIREKLYRRCEALMGGDPEAKALTSLLRELGTKEDLANSAVEQLFTKYTRKE